MTSLVYKILLAVDNGIEDAVGAAGKAAIITGCVAVAGATLIAAWKVLK